jgi:peptide chain release factor 1
MHLLQNRVIDYRIGLTLYNLDRVMDGDLGELIQLQQAADVALWLSMVTISKAKPRPGVISLR